MRYDEWEATVPNDLRADALWRRQDYRLALFAADAGWDDVRKLAAVRSTAAVADQLCRALGSIGPNIAEGYSRASGQDRARYYEYALGSARESRDWYHKARRVLGDDVARRRIRVLTSVVRLLTVAVPSERGTRLAPPAGHASGWHKRQTTSNPTAIPPPDTARPI